MRGFVGGILELAGQAQSSFQRFGQSLCDHQDGEGRKQRLEQEEQGQAIGLA